MVAVLATVWEACGRAIWLLVPLSLLALGAPAQPHQLDLRELRRQDSLRHLLQVDTRPDTARVNRLYALGFALRTNDVAQAIQLFWPSLKLAQQLHYGKGLANAQFGLGYAYRASNGYDSALYYTQRAIQTATRLGDGFNKTRGLYNLARIYHEQGNYGQALATSLIGLAQAQARQDFKGQLFQHTQLGLTNTALGEYASARQHLEQALRLANRLHDPIGTGHAYSGLGDLNREQGRWSLAGHYYAQAAASYRPLYNDKGMLPSELNLAEMTARQGGYGPAQAAAVVLLGRAQRTGTSGQVARAHLLLATIYLATERPDSAHRHASLSLEANRSRGLRQEAHDAAQVLAQACAQLGQWPAAYHYQRLTGDYADSLTSEATRRRAAALQLSYARSQQQIQIRLLTQQAHLQTQQQELERLRYRQSVAALIGLAGLVLAASAGLLWRYRRRETRRQNALRTRIAADLHDEVGSMLTQISMQSTLLREGRYTPAQQQGYLDQMAEASRRAARQMSDAVWSIDARYDSAASLLDRLRDHAYEVLPAAGLELDFSAEPAVAAVPLPLAVRQALYYIYKEALHNVVKHAQARQVRVGVRLLGQQLELLVHDDGLGLPLAGRAGGQGLPNMQMRAQAVGGSVTCAAAAPGTRVVVRLPVRRYTRHKFTSLCYTAVGWVRRPLLGDYSRHH